MPSHRILKTGLLAFVVLVLVGLGVFLSLPRFVDARLNAVSRPAPPPIGERARALHQRLWIADLHGDTLLWARDLAHAHGYGHIDLPRLRQGHVALQVFSTVTKVPRGLNFDHNPADSDVITALVMAERWPVRTWGSLLERALYQGQKLHEAAAASDGALRIVTSRAELAAALQAGAAYSGPERPVIALLSTEGLHPLEGRLENLDRMYRAGFRLAGITHFFDNELGGSAHGMAKGGLTPFGREVVQQMEARRMLVDLAHASPRVIDDVLAMAHRPVLVSHTGVQATCPGPRNLSDAHIRGIAATGGLIGIGYFDGAVCALDVAAIVRAMRHVADLVGVEHVALGSDFDGAVTTPFDASGIAAITQGLLDAGFSEPQVAAIMGGNVQRFLLDNLP